MSNHDEYPSTWGVAPGGEYYNDLLVVDSCINQRSIRQQASSLLCAKLQEREPKIRERVQYLADKHGVSFKTMWRRLAEGTYAPSGPGDWTDPTSEE